MVSRFILIFKKKRVLEHFVRLKRPWTKSVLPYHDDGFAGDIPAIEGWKGLLQACCIESKNLWCMTGPAIFTSLCQYSLGSITQTFAGHIGDLELASFSIENSVIANLSYGVMVGYNLGVYIYLYLRLSNNMGSV
ncbi:hypothetical protein SUGI_0350540 [Cryptomeria japonica]|nr:hypothetical protein SUGI_0350540 [Cryptomeria japonica]